MRKGNKKYVAEVMNSDSSGGRGGVGTGCENRMGIYGHERGIESFKVVIECWDACAIL